MATADPSAIGLFRLAIVTFVALTQKLDQTEGLGLFVQFYAFILVSKHNNTFSTTAYGSFQIGFAMTWFVQAGLFGETLQANVNQALFIEVT